MLDLAFSPMPDPIVAVVAVVVGNLCVPSSWGVTGLEWQYVHAVLEQGNVAL
jgi:hypothetical protein